MVVGVVFWRTWWFFFGVEFDGDFCLAAMCALCSQVGAPRLGLVNVEDVGDGRC